jgi:carboxypeptidase Taq
MSGQATTQSRYADAAKRLREITNLEGISGLLGWDEMVMIPTGSSESRAEQKAALTSAIYDRRTDPVFGDLLSSLQQASAELDDVQKAVVRDAAKDYRRSTAVPKELAQQLSRLESTAYEAWVSAKKDSDWSKFEPSYLMRAYHNLARRSNFELKIPYITQNYFDVHVSKLSHI